MMQRHKIELVQPKNKVNLTNYRLSKLIKKGTLFKVFKVNVDTRNIVKIINNILSFFEKISSK